MISRADRGRIVKEEIAHHQPSGIKGLVMNTRKPLFADWRVRQAMILAFNFEFVNKTLTGGREPRISSYFANSALAMPPGPATGKVAALLAPFAPDLLPGTLEGYALPVADGTAQNRRNMRAASKLLEEAGWTAGDDGAEDGRGNALPLRDRAAAGRPNRRRWSTSMSNRCGGWASFRR
ncbi:ABC transporter substrate-binding protein [Rhodobacter capsulatus]